MKPVIAVLFIALAAIGCKRADTTESANPPAEPAAMPADKPVVADPHSDTPKPTAANVPSDKSAGDVAADDTGKNERDRKSGALTPMDQNENDADRAITQQVRSDVVKADDMSMNGKNVKIITQDGVVTLRGPVASAREKKDIASIAKHVDGVKRIDNQLEVAAK